MNKDYYAGIIRGKDEERERIIALLEAKANELHAQHVETGSADLARIEQQVWSDIALIRGETND